MSFEITTAFVNQYRNSIKMLVQQTETKLRRAVSEAPVTGEIEFFEYIGPTEVKKVENRHGDSPLISTPHSRRALFAEEWEWGEMIDRGDKIKLLTDPASDYLKNASASFMRKMDDVIIAALDAANAMTGKNGNVPVAFGAGVTDSATVALNYDETTPANSNFNLAKWRRLKSLMDLEEVPEDGRYIVLGPLQIQSLLMSTRVTSADYNSVKALVNGEVNSMLGFEVIRSNRLPKSGNIRTIFAWHRDGVKLGVGQEMKAEIGKRADKRFNWYAYASMYIGATRMEEKLVYKCSCDETLLGVGNS